MTRYSASRGMMYTAPPTDDETTPAAEAEADDPVTADD